MSGYDPTGEVFSLAKNLLQQCEGAGAVSIEKATIKLVLLAYINMWAGEQDRKRDTFKKVAGDAR